MSADYAPLPEDLKGKTFEHVMGTNTSILESFVISKKLMGPGWMTLKNPVQAKGFKETWCDYELVCDSPKDIEVTIDDKNKASPPLTVMSFGIKTHKGQNKQKEIAMISCVVHERVECDRNTPNPKMAYKHFSGLRKVDGLNYPRGFEEMIKRNKSPVTCCLNEKGLLDFFIAKVKTTDPDMIVCHGLTNGIFDILLNRIGTLKIAHWSRLGRFKKQNVPRSRGKDLGGFFMPR